MVDIDLYSIRENMVVRDIERDVKMNILTLYSKTLLTTFTAKCVCMYVYIYIYILL